ncbi:MAG: AAA family ATPase [Anaerolineae bacterium]|nr:AAA family ATPase [Anaerolineae bacterium]
MNKTTVQPPANIEAETAILGSFLIDPEFAGAQVNSHLQPRHFYLHKHGKIYQAIQSLHRRGESIDIVTLSAELQARGTLTQVGGAVFLSQLATTVPSAYNIHHYADIVHGLWRRREALKLLSAISRIAYNEKEDLSAAADIEEQLSEILRTPIQNTTYPDFGSVSKTLQPIQWLWPQWVPRGMITLLGAVPGAGKSLVALDLAKRIIHNEPWPNGAPSGGRSERVIYVDAELVPQLLHARASSWGMDESKLYLMLPKPNDMIDFGREEYRAQLRSMVETIKPTLVVIDSLSSITTRGENNIEDIRSILGFLNELASNFQVGLILIHHLRKRGGAQMMDKSRNVSIDDFRGSGHIIAMARSVIALSTVHVTANGYDRNGPRKIEIVKTNLGAYPDPLGCEFKPLHPRGVFLEWSENAPQPYKEPTKAELCKDWLREVLIKPQSPADLVKMGQDEEGWSRSTIYRARRELGSLIKSTLGHQDPNNKWVLASVKFL